jgi:APA family basic amino acid/polyamine antiporter
MAGITRTALAMARGGDFPKVLGRIHERARVPRVAAIVLGCLVALLVTAVDVRAAIGVSSFGVLLYYLVANISALHQAKQHRRYPRAIQVAGAVGCAALAATLPWGAILGACVVVAAGLVYRTVRLARASRAAAPQ